MTINILEDIIPDDNKLKTVAELANELLILETRMGMAAKELERLSLQYKQLTEKTLPDAMLSAGTEKFTLTNGVEVSLDEGMSISVPKKNMTQVCGWLRENKHEDIISNEVVVPVPKGPNSETLVFKLTTAIAKLKLDFTKEENVHSGTLKALLKEQRSKGAVTDEELKIFGAYEWKKAVVKMPKNKK